MKKPTRIYKVLAALAVAVLFITSCSKEDPTGETDAALMERMSKTERPIKDKQTQRRIDALVGMLPTVMVYNSTMDRYISLDLNNPKSFSFTAPSGGASFSSPSGTVQFIPAPDGNFTILTTPTSSGGGSGGGLVSAGSISLDVNYVLCFASGDPNSDLNFFDFGPSGGGFSGAVGIAGNFEALASGNFDDDTDPFDFFEGIVAYYAFSGQPSGSFPVIDFFDFESNSGNINNKGLAYFVSFQGNQAGIFFSKSGSLNFSGSSVEFDGTYYGIVGNFFDFDFDDTSYIQVPGSGFLECGN